MQAHDDVTKLAFRPNGVGPALPHLKRALASGASGGQPLCAAMTLA